jgi:hypothetical protein
MLEDGADHRLMVLASELELLLNTVKSFLRTTRVTKLKISLALFKPTWTGSVKTGNPKVVIFGKNSLQIHSSGIEWAM